MCVYACKCSHPTSEKPSNPNSPRACTLGNRSRFFFRHAFVMASGDNRHVHFEPAVFTCELYRPVLHLQV